MHANASFVQMAQPCWVNLMHKACGQGAKGPPDTAPAAPRATRSNGGLLGASPARAGRRSLSGLSSLPLGAPSGGRGYVENVGWTSIRAPGEWSYGDGSRFIYYALREGEGEGSQSMRNAANVWRETDGMLPLAASHALRPSVLGARGAGRPPTRFSGGASKSSATRLQRPPATKAVATGSFALAGSRGSGGLDLEAVVPVLEVRRALTAPMAPRRQVGGYVPAATCAHSAGWGYRMRSW
jgi:hypothetical protein